MSSGLSAISGMRTGRGAQHRLIVRVATSVTAARDSIVPGIAVIRDLKLQYAKVPIHGDIGGANRRIVVINDNPAIHDDFRKVLSPGRRAQLKGPRRRATASTLELHRRSGRSKSRVTRNGDDVVRDAVAAVARGCRAIHMIIAPSTTPDDNANGHTVKFLAVAVERLEELGMMGHINNLLIRMVERHHGSEGVLRLFALARISRKQYQPEIVYPEEEFQALYAAAKAIYGVG